MFLNRTLKFSAEEMRPSKDASHRQSESEHDITKKGMPWQTGVPGCVGSIK